MKQNRAASCKHLIQVLTDFGFLHDIISFLLKRTDFILVQKHICFSTGLLLILFILQKKVSNKKIVTFRF